MKSVVFSAKHFLINVKRVFCRIFNCHKKSPQSQKRRLRALIAYWILGLCNNYGYVVMLTAADDIISANSDGNDTPEVSKQRNCTYMSTGAILLADILPALLVKICAPFIPFFVNIRVVICILVASVGYLSVAFSNSIVVSITGVVLTSFCSGLGEVTFLQYSSFYNKNVVSTWSSGTGGAGVIGALSYTILQQIGIRTTLIVMLIVPVSMGISFWIILPKPSEEDVNIAIDVQKTVNAEELGNPKTAFKKKLTLIPGLFKYMIPLGLVYLFEYFINQGTFELINFEHAFVSQKDQYRWLQVTYQVGVFLSRSSVNILHIRHVWIMSVLQLINVALYTTEAIFYYIPSFYIIIALTLWEGLLGGAAYVNTFYNISVDIPEENKQFSLAITSFADTIGITLAGVLAIFAHNKICDIPAPKRGY